MDGVTILSTAKEFAILPGLAFYLGISFAVTTVFFQIGVWDYGWISKAVLIVISIICVGFAIWGYRQPKDTVYKVIVEDSVSFNAFNGKYLILSQDGAIIKVMEREAEHD